MTKHPEKHTTLIIGYRPSMLLLSLLCVQYGGALFCVWVVHLPVWVQIGLSVWVVSAGGYGLRHLWGPTASRGPLLLSVSCHDEGHWCLIDSSGQWHSVILTRYFVSVWLIILQFKFSNPSRRVTVLLGIDAVPSAVFHLVIRWLRYRF